MPIISTVAVNMTVTMDWQTADRVALFIEDTLKEIGDHADNPVNRAARDLAERVRSGQTYIDHFKATVI